MFITIAKIKSYHIKALVTIVTRHLGKCGTCSTLSRWGLLLMDGRVVVYVLHRPVGFNAI